MTVTLPNGLAIEAPNALEAAMLYREIYVERTYRSQGIELSPGAIVFDVGANIGLFAIEIAQTVPGAQVHAFEPVPATLNRLRRNLAAHAPRTVVHPVAIGARRGTATFTVDPNMTLASSMHPEVFVDARSTDGTMAHSARAALDDLARADQASGWMRGIRRALDRAWSRPVALALLTPIALVLDVRRRLSTRRVRCDVEPLSDAIARTGAAHIDLLKIDVEGAEEAVLEGIRNPDWPRIRQLVIEVHDVGGRLARMTAALQQRGYQTTVAREDWATHEVLGIWTLYAKSI